MYCWIEFFSEPADGVRVVSSRELLDAADVEHAMVTARLIAQSMHLPNGPDHVAIYDLDNQELCRSLISDELRAAAPQVDRRGSEEA